MTIGLIVAMDKERDMLASLLSDTQTHNKNGQTFTEGQIGDKHIVLLQSGIGKVAAAVGACELIHQYAPDYIINSGVAGSLNAKAEVMHIVVGTKNVYHDVDCFSDNELGQIQGFPLYFEANKHLLDAAQAISSSDDVHFGLTCSGDQFITSLDELHKIIKNFPQGLAVDMESCSIAQVCYMYQIPFMSVRIVSDTPGINDHEKQYYDFWNAAPEKSLQFIKQMIEKI